MHFFWFTRRLSYKYISFNLHSCSAFTSFKMDETGRDGLESLIKILVLVPVLTILLGWPSGIWATHNNVTYFRFLNGGHFLYTVAIISHICIMYTVDWVLSLIVVLSIIFHFSSTSIWLIKAQKLWYVKFDFQFNTLIWSGQYVVNWCSTYYIQVFHRNVYDVHVHYVT